jgi:hypothetical protein
MESTPERKRSRSSAVAGLPSETRRKLRPSGASFKPAFSSAGA